MPDDADDPAGDTTDAEVLEAGREPRRRRLVALAVVVLAAAAVVVVTRDDGSSPDQPAPSPSLTGPLAGDPPGTLDTSVVRASGSCARVVDCPVQPSVQLVRGRVAAAVSATLGTPATLEVLSRATRGGAFYSRIITARTPAGRLLLVLAADEPTSRIVVVHAGKDTVFARDYRRNTYINGVLTGRDADENLARLQRLAADPRLGSG